MQKNFSLKPNIDWLIWLSIWITNQFIPIAGNENFFITKNGDSLSYLAVAKFCQGVMPTDPVVFQHAQRFFVPCVVGKLDQLTHLGIENIARGFTFFISLLSILGFRAILKKLGVNHALATLSVVFLVFNPYLFRLYNSMPLQLIDVSFVCAMIFSIYGLLTKSSRVFWVSFALCALTRQTAVLLLIPFAYYFFKINTPVRNAKFNSTLLALIFFFGFVIGKSFALKISGPNHNHEHFLGLGVWMRDSFNVREGIEFLIRAFIPFIGLLLLYLVWMKKKSHFTLSKFEPQDQKIALWLFVTGLFLMTQPLLGGPVIVAHAVARLMAYSVVPLLLLVTLLLDRSHVINSLGESQKGILWIAPVLISFHHIYTYNSGQSSDLSFRYALNSVVVLIVSAILIWKENTES
ncbi:MAG: hypothetical protein KA715_03205 [Xanthomonadaceae bacterium]|nr:hypothetical protein [Xanthomonadaceae bacterium]